MERIETPAGEWWLDNENFLEFADWSYDSEHSFESSLCRHNLKQQSRELKLEKNRKRTWKTVRS